MTLTWGRMKAQLGDYLQSSKKTWKEHAENCNVVVLDSNNVEHGVIGVQVVEIDKKMAKIQIITKGQM